LPELPELWVYRERLEESLGGARVVAPHVHDPFVLRTVEPPLSELADRVLTGVERRAKYLILVFEGPLHLAFHLMLAGRLHLKDAEKFRPHRKRTRLSLAFDGGTVLEMTEAGSKRRASVHLLGARDELDHIERGMEPFDPDLTPERLAELLRSQNRQLKKALRAPTLLSGIGNAYSDEILFSARLSPVRLTGRLRDEEIEGLHAAMRRTLEEWIARVRERCPAGLPVKQSNWRREMAVHGKTGEPCPRCDETIARISLRDSDTNYCPSCQNEGRLLADRRLSRFGIRRPPRRQA
jgi:formamidopyrimidine-DNA glycosylase